MNQLRSLLGPVIGFVLGACATATISAQSADAPPAAADGVRSERLVVPAGAAEVREAPSGKATIRILARGNNAFVGILEMDGGAAVPEHQDVSEEYIHVLQGEGTITIDGRSEPIAPGTTIFMPSSSRVSYANGAARLVALQVFAGPESAAKYDAWLPVTE